MSDDIIYYFALLFADISADSSSICRFRFHAADDAYCHAVYDGADISLLFTLCADMILRHAALPFSFLF